MMKIIKFFMVMMINTQLLWADILPPEIGDWAELTSFLNARSSHHFTKGLNNIKETLPPKTKGKILEYKKFSTGNYGVKLKLNNNKEFWVYYTPQKPNMVFSKEEDPTKKVKIEDANRAETIGKLPAISVNPKPDSAKLPGELIAVTNTVAKTLDQNSISKGECADCKSLFSTPTDEKKCENKDESYNQMRIIQRSDEGKCTVSVIPIENSQLKNSKEYNFYEDGHFEMVDVNGVHGYYFFPRKNQVGYKVSDDKKTVTIQTNADLKISISLETGKISSGDPVLLTATNNDGNYLLDLQYKGKNPERVKGGSAKLYNGSGKNCVIKNTELFNYHYNNDGVLTTVDFKFLSDEKFNQFAKSKCP